MSDHNLEHYNFTELKKMAEKMCLPIRRSKAEMIKDISTAFTEYEEYKKEKIDKYTKHKQLGEKGKEGITYFVTDSSGKRYAMKTFRKAKSSATLEREYTLQKKASKAGVAPRVYDYDTVSKYIVMEKMDRHLFVDANGSKTVDLTKSEQLRILEIFQKLDEVGVFHNDINILNFMVKKDQIYLIDYGFSKEITPKLCKTLRTDCPNCKLMTLGIVLKLKTNNAKSKSYKYLLRSISDEDKKSYGLV